jgi:hypothetical protein
VNPAHPTSLSLPGRHNNLYVVPADAGTHTPRPTLFRKVTNAGILADNARRMGSRFRGDDVLIVSREDGE